MGIIAQSTDWAEITARPETPWGSVPNQLAWQRSRRPPQRETPWGSVPNELDWAEITAAPRGETPWGSVPNQLDTDQLDWAEIALGPPYRRDVVEISASVNSTGQ